MSPAPHHTTIAAVATPPGMGAVSLVRISGPAAIQVADRATDGRVAAQPPRCARHCRVRDAAGRTLDAGLLSVFPGPHSYTGEDCVEFSGHGGILVTREVLDRLLACGALPAAPGEFTRRAFLNGKLDLTQAEGVMDLIAAQTRLSLRAARSQLDGILGQRTTAARDLLLETLAHLEALIDFPDEDLPPAVEALALADHPTYGLAAGLCTRDLSRAMRLMRALQVGTVWINRYGRSRDHILPTGGYKSSGMGKDLGRDAYHANRRAKSVLIDL
jgi:tRNA modification GTPase